MWLHSFHKEISPFFRIDDCGMLGSAHHKHPHFRASILKPAASRCNTGTLYIRAGTISAERLIRKILTVGSINRLRLDLIFTS